MAGLRVLLSCAPWVMGDKPFRQAIAVRVTSTDGMTAGGTPHEVCPDLLADRELGPREPVYDIVKPPAPSNGSEHGQKKKHAPKKAAKRRLRRRPRRFRRTSARAGPRRLQAGHLGEARPCRPARADESAPGRHPDPARGLLAQARRPGARSSTPSAPPSSTPPTHLVERPGLAPPAGAAVRGREDGLPPRDSADPNRRTPTTTWARRNALRRQAATDHLVQALTKKELRRRAPRPRPLLPGPRGMNGLLGEAGPEEEDVKGKEADEEARTLLEPDPLLRLAAERLDDGRIQGSSIRPAFFISPAM